MKWWINETKLNLNKKLCKSIFAKYSQNSQMVLSVLCNDDQICEKKLCKLFRFEYIQKSYSLIQFFLAIEPAEILGKVSLLSASYQLFLVLLDSHWVFFNDWKQTRTTMGQDRLSHLSLLCIEHDYVNRVDIEKVIDGFSSKKSLFLANFPIDFYTKQCVWFILNLVKKVN